MRTRGSSSPFQLVPVPIEERSDSSNITEECLRGKVRTIQADGHDQHDDAEDGETGRAHHSPDGPRALDALAKLFSKERNDQRNEQSDCGRENPFRELEPPR